MELPPGKLERRLPGGLGVLADVIRDLHKGKFTGAIRSSVYRGEDEANGALVFRRGREVLAGHHGSGETYGLDAVREIVRDSLSDNCILEVRTYDHGSSHVRVPQLVDTFPEARLDSVPDYDTIVPRAEQEERKRREAHAREQREAHRQERDLLAREETIYRKKWALEKEYERSREQQEELRAMREELKGASGKRAPPSSRGSRSDAMPTAKRATPVAPPRRT